MDVDAGRKLSACGRGETKGARDDSSQTDLMRCTLGLYDSSPMTSVRLDWKGEGPTDPSNGLSDLETPGLRQH